MKKLISILTILTLLLNVSNLQIVIANDLIYESSELSDDAEYDNSKNKNSNNYVSLFAYSMAYPNTHTNTGNQALDIASVAKTQVGYAETSNHTKYNQWFYGSDTDAAWCAIFISWCANQAGISTSAIAKNARASGYSTSNMNSNPYGCSAVAFRNRTPQIGDIIFVDNNSDNVSNHVGLVVDVDGTYIYTVEGIYSDKVSSVKYNRSNGYRSGSNSTKIVFYAVPDYIDNSQPQYYNPEGNSEGCVGGDNCFTTGGWAFDRDDLSQPVGIHIYIGDRCCAAFVADAYRPDVNAAYGVGDYHGFEKTIEVWETGEQNIRVFAINIGEGNNVLLGNYTVTITAPKEFTTNIYDGIVMQGNSYPICGTFKNAGTYPWLELFIDYGYVSTTCNNENNIYAFYLDTTKYSDGEHLIGIKERNQNGLDYTNWYNVIINNTHTVSFDTTDEHISIESKNVTWGQTYGELPTPKRTGYKFIGWFTAAESGEQITSDTTVTITKDQTLYAHWKKCETETIVTNYDAYKLCEVTVQNIDEACIVTIAGYKNNALVNIQQREYSENLKAFAITDDIDEVKVMFWDSLDGMKPITKVEIISSSEFITE